MKSDKKEEEINKELNQMKAETSVKIDTCKKEELMTLPGFDENKAKKLIDERKNGKMWYCIDDFCRDFNPKPHELIYIENRLIFPPIPNTNTGRRIDI